MINFIKNSIDNRISYLSIYAGSFPPLLKGWHLKILLIVKKNAFILEYLLKASIAYSEQVGLNLQRDLI